MSQVKKSSPKAKKASPVLRKSPLRVASKSKTPVKATKPRQTKPKVAKAGTKPKTTKTTKKGTPKKRVSRKSNAPKRPMSAFFLYMKDNRETIKRENPGVEFLDIPKIGATQWKALKQAQRVKYEALAEKEKQRYASEMTTYVPSPEDKKKKRKKKDPNAPKRPTLAYIYYVNSRQDRVRKEHPDYKMTEVMRALGAEWRALDAKSKKPFEDMATKDKVRYQKEMANYTPVKN